jgi:hypothetical protein
MMDLIASGNKENKAGRGFTMITKGSALGPAYILKPNSIPLTPEIPLSPLSHKGTGGLISRGRKWTGQTARKDLSFMCHVVDHALNKKKTKHMSGYCPIREISVERQGTRVKKFNVSEPRYFSGELLNFSEYRQSGTPGDFTGASFWYFLREKVLRDFMGQFGKLRTPNISPPLRGGDRGEGEYIHSITPTQPPPSRGRACKGDGKCRDKTIKTRGAKAPPTGNSYSLRRH